jgi:hypothetical protein
MLTNLSKEKIVGKRNTQSVTITEPIVIVGSHSIRTEYPDGRVEFESDWDKLKADVEQALAEFALGKTSEEPVKPKKTRKKKVSD